MKQDRSFTCTLFAPTGTFDELAVASREQRRLWFKEQFPDALELIGADLLLNDLERNPRSALISIQASKSRRRLKSSAKIGSRRTHTTIRIEHCSSVMPHMPWYHSTDKVLTAVSRTSGFWPSSSGRRACQEYSEILTP
jgi:hypothetical protein